MLKKISVAVMVILGVLMLAYAIVGMFKPDPSGITSISEKEMMWVKCCECEEVYEHGAREYYEFQEANKAKMAIQPLMCKKCGKNAVYKAFKCEKCEHVFLEGSVPNTFSDTCPKCGFSKTNALRGGAAS